MEIVNEIVRIKQEVRQAQSECDFIYSPDDAAKIAYQYIGEDDREVMFVMCLNNKNGVVAVHRAHVGGLNQSIATPREIYKAAILNNAASIVIAHQHPSSGTEPSREDVKVSQRIGESGKILGTELLDSLVIGEYKNNRVEHASLKERDYL